MPRVSVIITTYNDQAYIAEALNSVRSQSFTDWEAVIINDGSTDNTEALVRSLADAEPRFRFYSYAHNRGIIPCLQEAVALAQGQYHARLGADDAWVDHQKLSRQVEFLDSHPDYGLVGTWAEVVDLQSQSLYYMQPATTDNAIRRQLLSRNQFIDTSVLYRKNLAIQAGGYRLPDSYNEDYSLALRLGQLARLANLPLVMVRYRINPRGVTQTRARQRVTVALGLIREHQGNYPHYWWAWLHWRAQYAIIALGSVAALNQLKRLFYKVKSYV